MTEKNNNSGVTSDYALPLVIAVTGHRDLLENELPAISARVRTLFKELLSAYPSRRLTIMSPLAEGADTLVAEIAIEMALDLVVPIPKDYESYLQDFRSEAARQQFLKLSAMATNLYHLPVEIPGAPSGTDSLRWQSDYPYAQLGVFLSAHCHILLALWDGAPSQHLGGTAQVVKFHQDNYMPGITSKSVASQQMLIDDENDLVFHLVCSRHTNDTEPKSVFEPLDWFWSTKDFESPLSKELPQQHRKILQRSTEFGVDAIRFHCRIRRESSGLLRDCESKKLPEGIENIDRLFKVSDWLAVHYQRKTVLTLRITHLVAFFMGLMFLLYSDFEASPSFLLAFVGFFGFAALIQAVAKRGAWQRKYLDYRTLAEGLRVQFYWAAAGVRGEDQWMYVHDNFLQMQDPEVGWIRDVMRVAGARSDAQKSQSEFGLCHALKRWVGDNNSGQLYYYKSQALMRSSDHRLTQRLGLVSLLGSVAIVLFSILVGASMSDSLNTLLMLTMGTLLLLFAVREGYTYATAVKELTKQYNFMYQVFKNAHLRLNKAANNVERRLILLALGQTVLDENASWILMHRERSLDQGELWRMGS